MSSVNVTHNTQETDENYGQNSSMPNNAFYLHMLEIKPSFVQCAHLAK
jgi:hypothetical protein